MTKKEREKRNKKIIKLYKSGMSSTDVARRVGLTKSGVRYILHKAGVMRSQSEAQSLPSYASKKGYEWHNGKSRIDGKNPPEYKMWRNAWERARKKGLPFDLALEDIVIPENCPVFGFPLVPGGHTYNSPTLDRIIPENGYVKGNVVVISMKANAIKQDVTDPEDFRKLADWLEKELDKNVKIV